MCFQLVGGASPEPLKQLVSTSFESHKTKSLLHHLSHFTCLLSHQASVKGVYRELGSGDTEGSVGIFEVSGRLQKGLEQRISP